MSNSSNRNRAGPRSWRSSAASSNQGSSLNVRRWFVTLLALALCAAFVAILMRGCGATGQLVAVAIPYTDRFTASSVGYPLQNIKAPSGVSNVEYHGWDETTAARLELRLGNAIKQLTSSERFSPKRNVLLVYLNAHGVSDDGKAYVLCSDYERSGAEGLYPISQLLNDLDKDQSQAAQKLLILDAGRLESDPCIGMVVNEFPRLVEEQVKLLSVQPLWVLLSNSTFQISHVDHACRRSLFGASVVEALEGKADGEFDGDDLDNYVTLPEFCRYVHRRCVQWSTALGAPVQTPLLLKAGVGRIDMKKLEGSAFDGKEFRLFHVKDRGEKDAQAESGPAAEGRGRTDQIAAANSGDAAAAGGSTNERQAAEKAASGDSGGQADGADQLGGNVPDGESAGTAGDQLKAQDDLQGKLQLLPPDLHEAWQLRDEIQDRSRNVHQKKRWSPIDFAPHLWRRLNEQLLHYEQELLWKSPLSAEPPDDETDLVERVDGKPSDLPEIRKLVRHLVNLRLEMRGISAQAARPATDDQTTGARLRRAWRRFQESDAKRGFEKGILADVSAAFRDYRDAVFWLPYQIHLYDAFNELSVGGDASDCPLMALMDDLDEFNELLATMQGKELDPNDQALAQLRTLHAGFVEKRQRVERRVKQWVAQARDTPGPSRSSASSRRRRPIEATPYGMGILLSTPLVPVGPRTELMRRLSSQTPTDALDTAPMDRDQDRPTPEQWQSLLARTTAEAKRVRLADDVEADGLETILNGIEDLTDQLARPDTEAKLWEEYREIGARLKRFNDRLPVRINRAEGTLASESTVGGDVMARDRLLRSINARDAFRLQPWQFAQVAINIRVDEDVQFRECDDELVLTDQEDTFQFVIEATKRELLSNSFELDHRDYDSSLLEVKPPSERTETKPDPKTGNEVSRKTVVLRIQALRDRERAGRATTPVRISYRWARAGQQVTTEHRLDCFLPFPNRVDVTVQPKGLATVQSTGDSVTLKLPPNRDSEFEVGLDNRSGRARSVIARLFAVPPRQGVGAGRPEIDAGFQTLDEATMSLPSEGRRLIQFGTSDNQDEEGDEPQPAENGQPSAPAEKEETPANDSSVDVSHGLLCAVLDSQSDEMIGYTWIKMDCLTPSQYLTPEVSYRDQAIEVHLAAGALARSSGSLIPAEAPIRVKWTDPISAWLGPRYIETGMPAELEGDVTSDQPRVVLSATVPPTRRAEDVKDVYLHVDGYPRAFHYVMECREGESGEDRKRDHTRIHIAQALIPGFDRVYHWPSNVQDWTPPPPAPGEDPDKATHIALRLGQPAVFPARVGDVEVKIHADVPVDAWNNPASRIEVGIRGKTRYPVRSERRQITNLRSTRPQLRLEMRVLDHSFPLRTSNISNDHLAIDARVVLAGIPNHRQDRRQDSREIWLDGDRPRIVDVRQKPGPGPRRPVEVQVEDFSGVERVDYGFDMNDSLELDEDELISREFKSGDVRLSGQQAHVFEIEVDTETVLKALKPGQSARQRLLLRVHDKVGQQSDLFRRSLVISKPGLPPVNDKTNLVGVIRRRGVPVNGIQFKATIEGGQIGTRPVAVKPDGSFRVDGLKPGDYTLKATGSFNNRRVEGEEKLTVPPVPLSQTKVDISVDYPPKK